MTEIERKFLVLSDAFKGEAERNYAIAQGYLNSDPARTVRVRIKGDKGFLTIKGLSDAAGVTRFEWEKEIALAEANLLLDLCEKGSIVKTRYEVRVGQHTFEVDVFEGENAGLMVAEIELSHADEPFEKPYWLGEEVTGDNRYYNASLSRKPYGDW